MRTNRLHYLDQKPHQELNIKAILLALVASIFLAACGIKGDLYQTPEQAVISKDKVIAPSDEGQNENIKKSVKSPQKETVSTLEEPQKKQAVEQLTEQPAAPVVKPSTDQVKEQP